MLDKGEYGVYGEWGKGYCTYKTHFKHKIYSRIRSMCTEWESQFDKRLKGSQVIYDAEGNALSESWTRCWTGLRDTLPSF